MFYVKAVFLQSLRDIDKNATLIMAKDSPEEQYRKLYDRIYSLCVQNEWGDPHNYARAKEIYLAGLLGHKLVKEFSGGDAIDDQGECEYKTTTGKNINARYAGISNYESWKKQKDYLKKEKIAKYKNHYIARFEEGKVAEVWRLKGSKVLNILEPKFKNSWRRRNERKDPRISASISMTEIKKYGEKIYPK